MLPVGTFYNTILREDGHGQNNITVIGKYDTIISREVSYSFFSIPFFHLDTDAAQTTTD